MSTVLSHQPLRLARAPLVHTILFALLIGLPCRFAVATEWVRDLSVATWNFENLSSAHGSGLFSGRSFERTERDFDAFRKYVIETSADVFLLQEVASPKAMRLVLPAKYSYLVAPAYFDSTQAAPAIHTGIAFDPAVVKVIGTLAIPTGITYTDSAGRPTRARDTVGIQLAWGATRVWVFSAHLKSSCSRKTPPTDNASTDCNVLQQQLLVLRDWVTRLRADGALVIIGGDFNRRGDPDDATDPYLSLLDTPTDTKMLVRPLQRDCASFSGKDRRPIDYFVLYGLQNAMTQVREINIHEHDLRAGFKLSDHCPVRLQLSPAR